jgi:hypothetical protein
MTNCVGPPTEKTYQLHQSQQLRPWHTSNFSIDAALERLHRFIKRTRTRISLQSRVPSPILDCAPYSGFCLTDLCVSELVLQNSDRTWLQNVDYSLNISLHLSACGYKESKLRHIYLHSVIMVMVGR